MEYFSLFGIIYPFIALFLFILHIVSCIWAYRDALSKGRSQEFAIIVLLAILFFPILGIIIYVVIRNDGSSSSGRY